MAREAKVNIAELPLRNRQKMARDIASKYAVTMLSAFVGSLALTPQQAIEVMESVLDEAREEISRDGKH